MLKRYIFVAGMGLMTAPAALMAQDNDQTLADIRQQLTVLNVEVQKLRRELSTTGGASVETGGNSVLERVSTMESELQRLTSKTEEMENRINDPAFRSVAERLHGMLLVHRQRTGDRFCLASAPPRET